MRFDSGGTIWLGFQGGVSSTPDSSVAMLRPPWARIVTFPPLSVFVSSSPVTVASVGINSSANRIWFPDFYRNEVSRLQKLTLD